MADEFKHKDVGDELSKPEYHGIDAHEADSQAAGDLIYCDGTYWKRVGKGANGLYLKAGSVPYWEAILDGDIPASIARDAEVDYKISAYAAPLIHHTRHDWLGDDALSWYFAFLASARIAHVDWQTPDAATIGWTEAVSGTGVVTYSLCSLELNTGASSGGHAHMRAGGGLYMANAYVRFLGRLMSSCAASVTWLYTSRNISTSVPANTHQVKGFKMVNGAMWSYTCDNAGNEETNDLGITWGIAQQKNLVIYSTSGAVYFYVDEVLVATHTTVVPGYFPSYLHMDIISTANGTQKYINSVVDYVKL